VIHATRTWWVASLVYHTESNRKSTEKLTKNDKSVYSGLINNPWMQSKGKQQSMMRMICGKRYVRPMPGVNSEGVMDVKSGEREKDELTSARRDESEQDSRG